MPERVIRWLHLSDFHCEEEAQNAPLDACIGELQRHIRERCGQGRSPDLVFVTGDIAKMGLEKEYQYFSKFLAALQKILGDSVSENIYVIPGNHDVCRDEAVMALGKERHVYKEFPESMYPDKKGLKLRKEILPRFSDFMGSCKSPVMGNWLESIDGYWSKVVKVADYEVGVLATNTAWFSKDKTDKGKLTPGVLIIRKGLESIKDASIKVVLGHHPLSWFDDSQAQRIAEYLGRERAIYLHGHLHRSSSIEMEGGGGNFRIFASGAVFEPPKTGNEDDPLTSRLNWVEVDLIGGKIYVEPFKLEGITWLPDTEALDKRFRVEGENRWWFDLPGYKAPETPEAVTIDTALEQPQVSGPVPTADRPAFARKKPEMEEVVLPKGWGAITAQFLATQRGMLTGEEVLAYFGGLEPNWALALSTAAPRRQVVFQLRDQMSVALQGSKCSVHLLTGPSGEGKSTILLQTVDELLRLHPNLLVIFHKDAETSLPVEFFANLPPVPDDLLLAADEANLIADDIYESVRALHEHNRHDVHFLLAARDSAWVAAEGHRKPWPAVCDFKQREVRGLDLADAKTIIAAWRTYGKEGLGPLAGQNLQQAAEALVATATNESAPSEGSLFGALMDVRYGSEGLKYRILTLLESFVSKQALPELSLLKAYAYIAAPHAVGIDVLTKDILARVFKCRPGDVLPVVQRFGKEAFLAVPGRFITTRHQKIAETACELLGEQFGVDMDEVYVDLIKAAVGVIRAGGYVPHMYEWDRLPGIFAQNRPDLALRLIEAQRQAAPNDKFYLSKHSSLLRGTGDKEGAARLFRDSSLRPRDNRGFYFEWASAEGEAGHYAINAWLAAYSLADAGGRDALGREQAKKSLAGLGVPFLKLHEATQDLDYAQATGAVGQLGPRVADDPKGLSYFQYRSDYAARVGVGEQPPDQAWQAIERAIKKAWESCKNDLPDIPPASGFTYRQLLNLLNLPQDTPA